MKHTALFTFSLFLLAASAAIPQRWPVDVTRVQPATFEAVQGEKVDFEAALHCEGKPFAAPSSYSFFWQTNGMGNLYWSRPCQPPTTNHQPPATNVLYATWLPEYDVGARSYNCFIGLTNDNFRALFQLRMRPGPGATPNELPLPQKVIDFSKVTVLNPPWSGGGSGGVDTNAVREIIHATVDGSARPLPRYLWALDFCDTYPEEAAWYYAQDQAAGGCSAVRDGGFLYRNYDYPYDDREEFVVSMAAGAGRFASVGVANVGTNITEKMVTSGMPLPSRYYKALPGRVVDGINENGVVCEVNVVSGEPPASTGGDIHPLAAVRWALDNGTSAGMAASNIAARVAFPEGWTQNFHWMIADERETWIVENGTASNVTGRAVMTNFPLIDFSEGEGWERYQSLTNGANITSQWWTAAYDRNTWPIRYSDLGTNYESIWSRWDEKPREAHRGEVMNGQTWWQTVHCSIYDITNRTLRIAVQEVDDWYTFAVPAAGCVKPDAVRGIVEPMIDSAIEDNEKTGTDQQIVRGEWNDDLEQWDIRVDWSYQNEHSDYAEEAGSVDWQNVNGRPDVNLKRDKTDNICHETEFTEWNEIHSDNSEVDAWLQQHFDTSDCYIEKETYPDGSFADWRLSGEGAPDGWERLDYDIDGGGNEDSLIIGRFDNPTHLQFYNAELDVYASVVVKRSRFATAGQPFVTADNISLSPSPKLRVYDEIRQCWWIGTMVNGVINWEVE